MAHEMYAFTESAKDVEETPELENKEDNPGSDPIPEQGQNLWSGGAGFERTGPLRCSAIYIFNNGAQTP
jgi:hypothetical protein